MSFIKKIEDDYTKGIITLKEISKLRVEYSNASRETQIQMDIANEEEKSEQEKSLNPKKIDFKKARQGWVINKKILRIINFLVFTSFILIAIVPSDVESVSMREISGIDELNMLLVKQTIAESLIEKVRIEEAIKNIDSYSSAQISLHYSSKDYGPIDNFAFQYVNTIRGWVGKSVGEYNDTYRDQEDVNEYSYLVIGKYLPYIIFIMVVFLNLKTNRQTNKANHN